MIETVVETITPEKAREYLRANTKNPRGQNVRMARVKQYARDMVNGMWELNGEAIVFDDHGVLKNGAHRLAAVVLANRPVEMVVIRGVDEKVTAFDLTYVRTVAQLANADDINVQPQMLRAVKMMYALMPDYIGTHMEVKAYAKRHEDDLNRASRCLLESKRVVGHVNKKTSCSLAAYLMLQTKKMPFYEIELFFRVFSTQDTTGTDGYETSPVLIARRMFDGRWDRQNSLSAQREQLDILTQAMADFHAGKERKVNYKISQPFAFEPLLKQMGGDM